MIATRIDDQGTFEAIAKSLRTYSNITLGENEYGLNYAFLVWDGNKVEFQTHYYLSVVGAERMDGVSVNFTNPMLGNLVSPEHSIYASETPNGYSDGRIDTQTKNSWEDELFRGAEPKKVGIILFRALFKLFTDNTITPDQINKGMIALGYPKIDLIKNYITDGVGPKIGTYEDWIRMVNEA